MVGVTSVIGVTSVVDDSLIINDLVQTPAFPAMQAYQPIPSFPDTYKTRLLIHKI